MTFTEHELRRIEEISQNASRPERGVMLDGWSVGLSPSKAKRSRCVNAFYEGVRSFEVNLAETQALYRRAQLPCVFRITPFVADRSLDATLQAAFGAVGGAPFDETYVQTMALYSPISRTIVENTDALDIITNIDSSPVQIGRIVQMLRGDSDVEIASLVARWQCLPLKLLSYTAIDRHAHQPLAHVLTLREGNTIGVFDVITAPTHRGRGLATQLLARALDDAANDGATQAYLQVVNSNPARRVYERLGFRTAYAYWYREVPVAT